MKKAVILYSIIASSLTLMEVLLTIIGYYYPNLLHNYDRLNPTIKAIIHANAFLFIGCYWNLIILFITGIVLLFVRSAIKFGVFNICACLLFYFLALSLIGDSL
jgi:hypothetical protein